MGTKGTGESEFLSLVVRYAALKRWHVFHPLPAANRRGRWATYCTAGGTGFPDLCMARAGRVVFAELKVPPNDTTAAQDSWLAALTGGAAEVYLWTPDQWQDIQRVLS